MQDQPDSNAPDSGLDGLFRKSAEEFEPLYDPAAWQDMQRRLSRHDRTVFWKAWTRRLLPVGLAAILILLISGYWLIQRQATVADQPVGVTKPKQVEISTPLTHLESRQTETDKKHKVAPVGEPPTMASVRTVAPATVPAAGQPVANRKVPEPVATTHPQRTNTNGKAGTNPTNRLIKSEQLVTGSERIRAVRLPKGKQLKDRSLPELSNAFPTNQLVAAQVVSRRFGRAKSRVPKAGYTTADRVGLYTPTAPGSERAKEPPTIDRRLVNPDYVPGTDEPVTPVGKSTNAPVEEAISAETAVDNRLQLPETTFLTNRPARWPTEVLTTGPTIDRPAPGRQPPVFSEPRVTGLSIQVVLSPDLSAIGLGKVCDAVANKPGTNVGLLFNYRLSNRWSIQTGILHSLKVYKASGSDYVWPPSWNWPLWFDGVDARCAMLDVPFNVRYDVFVRPVKSNGRTGASPARWFVSGGVTSYVILKERYDYEYDNPKDPRIQAWKWEGQTGTYGLSELNTSIGYERPISRRLSWQVEPFLKVPLRQVGFFKVRLISTGAFLSLRYRL